MSAQPPQALQGTEAPSQIEFLWERYRPLVWTIVAAIVVALGVNYGWKYLNQKKVDETWSRFASTAALDDLYTAEENRGFLQPSLIDSLEKVQLADLEKGLADADDAQKPFLLLAIARKAMLDTNWERAESALSELAQKYPKHSLVKTSDYPVQVRKPEETDEEPANPNQRPDLQPAEAGSVVSRMQAQLAAARAYQKPAQFAPIEPPADAKKVKFEFSNGASFTIALMPEFAPKHVEAFLEFAQQEGGYWTGMAVDEIRREGQFGSQPRELHLGFASTREDDRTKWITTEPSEKPLEFEASKLSHYPGAVSGRPEAEGKSCADRFWIVADDAPSHDGERVIFGFVVDGLDSVKSICEESLSAQDEQRGAGRPTENIRVTAVTVLE